MSLVEFEKALVGCALAGNLTELAEVRADAPPEALTHRPSRTVYEALCIAADECLPLTTVEIGAVLERSGGLESVGGLAGIDAMRGLARMDERQKLIAYVRNAARLRVVGCRAQKLGETCNHPVAIADPERYFTAITALAHAVRGEISSRPKTAAEGCREATLALLERGKKVAAISTRIGGLDKILNPGLKAKKTYVWAARPSAGKTALAVQLISAGAMYVHPQLFFSCEMPHREVIDRVVVQRTQIDSDRYETGVGEHGMTESEIRQVIGEMQRVAEWPMWTFDEETDVDVMLAKTKVWLDVTARPLIAATPPVIGPDGRELKLVPAVWLDYFQRARLAGEWSTTEQMFAQMSQRIANFARSEAVAFNVLAQATKDNVRENRAPRASDLKYCDALCADADVVTLIHRRLGADTSEPIEGRGRMVEEPAMLIVDKHRGGRVGVAWTTWHGPTVRFTDREPTGEGYWTPNDKKAASGRGQKR